MSSYDCDFDSNLDIGRENSKLKTHSSPLVRQGKFLS